MSDLSNWSSFKNSFYKESSLSAKYPRIGRKKRINPTPLISKYITEQLTEPTLISGKGIIRAELDLFINRFLKGEPKNIEVWQQYRRAYDRIPLVAGAIDITTDNTIQSFHISGPNKEKIQELKKKFNLVEFFHNVCKQMLIYGNSFVEIVKDSSGIVDLKILPPIQMFVNRDKKGNFRPNQPDAYLQYLPHKPMDPIAFSYDEVVHFKLNPIGESAYGNSIIHPLLLLLQIKINTESNMDTILERYAAPLMHFQVGTPEQPATQAEIDAMSADLQDIQADTELVTDHRVVGTVLGSENKAMNIEPYLDYLENQIITGLQVPLVLLGRGDMDRAVAEVQFDAFDRRVKTIQRTIKRIAERRIFKAHLGDVSEDQIPELMWGEPEQRQSREDMELIIQLKSSGIITAQKANSLLPEEYQEKLPEEIAKPQPQPFMKQPPEREGKEPPLDRIKTARDKRKPTQRRN